MQTNLPSFGNPPVIETVISSQFEPLPRFGTAHLGLFWSLVRDEFPQLNDTTPLEPQYEKFDPKPGPVQLPTLQIMQTPPAVRMQMVSPDGQMMIQIQNGRVVFNWKKVGDSAYPRWSACLEKFDYAWDKFQSFIAEQGLGEIVPNQWETTYVNHLLRGVAWESPDDWCQLLPGLIGSKDLSDIINLETFSSKFHYEIPDQQGRLHVDLRHGYTSVDSDPVQLLFLMLTARGKVGKDGCETLHEGLGLGHETIVKAFDQMIGDKAKQAMGRR